jgi:hypothetical protein
MLVAIGHALMMSLTTGWEILWAYSCELGELAVLGLRFHTCTHNGAGRIPLNYRLGGM